jgi:hypothetical protein
MFLAGCAVELSSDLSLDEFNRSPSGINVSAGDAVVSCDLTITTMELAVLDAGCVFKSASGHVASCLATSAVGDIWSCDATVLENAEHGTWTIDYVFARDTDGNKLRATGAELVADTTPPGDGVLRGEPGRVDLAVTSASADTTPPTITTFDGVSLTVYPGSPVTCRVLTDEDPVKNIGCTFVPDDGSESISCLSHGSDTCYAPVPSNVDVGVIYNEINHFARDASLNLSVGFASKSLTVIVEPTTGTIAVDMSALLGACTGASWGIDPGGLSGSADLAATDIAPGAYTITWLDTALACTNPAPELKAVVLEEATTFDLVSANYTTKSTFSSVNTEVCLGGCPGGAPPGGGAWEMVWDDEPIPASPQFVATGTGNVTGVAPAQGDFYVGRDYTLNWTPEAGHTTPSPNAITAAGDYQGNYIDLGGDTCAAYTADYTANDGWSTTVDEGDPAAAELTFDFYARPATANQDANFVVAECTAPACGGTNTIADFNDAAILIGFNSSGTIDVRDGDIYCDAPGETPCNNTVPYVPGEWYHFVVNASIAAQSYTVQVETCDDGLVTVMTDAQFRTSAQPVASLGYHAAWSSQTENLDINLATEGAWMPGVCSGVETCASEGYNCGSPLDECGDVVADAPCGTCGGSDVCFPEGTCCAPNTTVCTDPDPNYECGVWPDGCGSTVNCDTGGETCDERVPGESCAGGQCVAGAAPYVFVTPADVGVTIGPGVVAPVPTEVYSGPTTIEVNGTVIENVIFASCPWISANNVLFRNVIVNCNDGFFGVVINGANGVTIEYSTLRGGTDKSLWLHNVANVTFYRNDIWGGEDWVYMDASLDNMRFEDNYMHHMLGGAGTHADGFQWEGTTGTTFVLRGNYFSVNNSGLENRITDLLNIDYDSGFVTFENNFIAEPFGWYTLRYYNTPGGIVRNNIFGQGFKTALPAGDSPSHALYAFPNAGSTTFECNRYEDGTFVEPQYVNGDVTYIVSGCQSYP